MTEQTFKMKLKRLAKDQSFVERATASIQTLKARIAEDTDDVLEYLGEHPEVFSKVQKNLSTAVVGDTYLTVGAGSCVKRERGRDENDQDWLALIKNNKECDFAWSLVNARYHLNKRVVLDMLASGTLTAGKLRKLGICIVKTQTLGVRAIESEEERQRLVAEIESRANEAGE